MKKPTPVHHLLLVFFTVAPLLVTGQRLSSSALYHGLLQLKETRRVLYVAAHPDDENTQLIAYLANSEHAQVAYLSLTRGDGGQNLIGKELGVQLGQIRTQELLKARETDGGRQYFTRAMDFGYSKNPDETLQNWDRESVLSDVVWVIRRFQPDVIITRFNTIPGVTHGHHTTSAILAGEAFGLAADPDAFPEQLSEVTPWKTSRLFWNAYNFGGEFEPEEGKLYHSFATGGYNSLLGSSYSQIAADSRTMHKSQGFGSTARIGEATDYIQFLQGEAYVDSPFDGIPNRWEEVQGGREIEDAIEALLGAFDFREPGARFEDLMALRKRMGAVQSPPVWLQEKTARLDALILDALGVVAEFNSKTEFGYQGQEVTAEFILNNPSDIPLTDVAFAVNGKLAQAETAAAANKPVRIPASFTIADMPLSQPYWLERPASEALYTVDKQADIGRPFNETPVGGTLSFALGGALFELEVPLHYKYNDPVDGEIKQSFAVVPEVDLVLSKEVVFLLSKSDPSLRVTVRFRGQLLEGELGFEHLTPEQYRIISVEDDPVLKQRVYQVEFLPNGTGINRVTASYTTSSGQRFDQVTHLISYKHIPHLTYFTPADLTLIQEDWEVSGGKIGYIPGAGDDVPGILQALGYQVTELGPADYTPDKLSQYQTIIVGIRAYNTNTTLATHQQVLMGYVRAGGNVIVQYNTSSPLLTSQLGPYPFTIGRTRVAVQDAPVTVDWDHPVMTTPNRLSAVDFEYWVQERGLYFAEGIHPNYETPLSMHDPEEDPSAGSLLITRYGEGTFTYTGLSFFRQLPAAVPGAVKLFINLIEQ